MKRKSKKNSIPRIILKLIPEVIKAVPGMFLLDVIICFFHGISWGLIVLVQQKFFDQAGLLVNKQASMKSVVLVLVILGITYVFCHVLNGGENYYSDVLSEKLRGKLSIKIHKKVDRLSAIEFEDTKKLNDINKAENGKDNAVAVVVVIKDLLFFYVPYFVFMGWYLSSLKPSLVFAIILVFIPTVLTQIIRTNLFDKLEDNSVSIRRENEYYEKCIVDREFFKETRTLGAYSYFKKLFLSTLEKLQILKYKVTLKSNIYQLLLQMVTVGGYLGILLMLFYSLIHKDITIGAFVAVLNSISMMYENMEEIVCEQIGEVAENIGTVKNYINFIEMEEVLGTCDNNPGWGDIVFDHVSFTYPNANSESIKDVSFTLKKGETVAVVGINGSGKTTLVHLLTGLYLPQKGRITINGVDTKDLTSQALFTGTSAVMQKYQRYQMTLSENIMISDTEKVKDIKDLNQVCEMAGVDIAKESFPNDYDTMLSKEFDGVDLSGGQWQRIAIARAFFRDHNTIVLDEPTAAIDPYQETCIYNKFAEISRNKSAVIVTHRLGSVKLADRIIVLNDGQIEEMGTHDELITHDGEYKKLYKSQEQWYSEK